MPYLLLLDQKGLPVREWKIGNRPLWVGRARAMDISVEDPRLSRRHFQIDFSEKQVRVKDMESKTGLRVNGEKASTKTLKSGDMIEAGNSTFMFEAGTETLLGKTEAGVHHSTIGKVIQDLRMSNPDT